MIIVGTRGLAKDIISSMELDSKGTIKDLGFFDNINTDIEELYGYPVYHSFEMLQEAFKTLSSDFIVCVGNPLLRKRIAEKVKDLGGNYIYFVSERSAICPLIERSNGLVIQAGGIISREVTLGEGVFINANAVIGHDVIIEDYVSVGPGAKILGYAEIGAFSYIGANAVILPGVKIGSKVRIGIGKVIDQDVPDNTKVI